MITINDIFFLRYNFLIFLFIYNLAGRLPLLKNFDLPQSQRELSLQYYEIKKYKVDKDINIITINYYFK